MSKQMTVAIAGLGSRGRDTYAKAAKIKYPLIVVILYEFAQRHDCRSNFQAIFPSLDYH